MFRHFNFHQLTFLPSILWAQEPAQSVKYFQISRLFLCRPSLSLPASTILNIWNIWLQHCSNCSIHADIRLTLNITHWGTFVLIYRNGTVSQHRRTSTRMGTRLTKVLRPWDKSDKKWQTGHVPCSGWRGTTIEGRKPTQFERNSVYF